MVRLVVGEVSGEPLHVRLPFERQNVRGNAIKEPAVVRDHQHGAGKIQQRFFERAQRFHVQIIGGLIEQQDVRPAAQQFRQLHAIAFTAGQIPHPFLLVGAFEVEAGNVAA